MRSKIDDADIIELVDSFVAQRLRKVYLITKLKGELMEEPIHHRKPLIASDGGQLRDDKIVEKLQNKRRINQQALRNISRFVMSLTRC